MQYQGELKIMKNNIKLDAVKSKINISDYTLQDIAKYFLKYDGYTCEIKILITSFVRSSLCI